MTAGSHSFTGDSDMVKKDGHRRILLEILLEPAVTQADWDVFR